MKQQAKEQSFNDIIKQRTIELITETSLGLKAGDVADTILKEYKSESLAWAKDKIRQHIMQMVERLLRAVPSAQLQTEFATEDFKDCFNENPELPAILGVLDEDLEMTYKLAVDCTDEDLQKIEDYTLNQASGLQSKVDAVKRFRDYRNDIGVPSDQSLRLFVEQCK